jgi:hypothetical protein
MFEMICGLPWESSVPSLRMTILGFYKNYVRYRVFMKYVHQQRHKDFNTLEFRAVEGAKALSFAV